MKVINRCPALLRLLLLVFLACPIAACGSDDDTEDESDRRDRDEEEDEKEPPKSRAATVVTVHHATVEDEWGTPNWYGILVVSGEDVEHAVKLGPAGGCTPSVGTEEVLLQIDCWWAGGGQTMTVNQTGTDLLVSTTWVDEGMEEEPETNVLHTLALGSQKAQVLDGRLEKSYVSFDELKAFGVKKGTLEKSLPRPDRPNPITDAKYKYTSVSLLDGKCEWFAHGYTGHSSDDYKCPGFGGYTPMVYEHQDAGLDNPDLKGFTVRSLSLTPPDSEDRIRFEYDPKDFPKGDEINLSNKLIEWRYREVGGRTDVHGLIHRYYGTYDATGKTKLFVARLEGGYGCIVGTARSNTEARTIADDMSLRCSGPNKVAGGW